MHYEVGRPGKPAIFTTLGSTKADFKRACIEAQDVSELVGGKEEVRLVGAKTRVVVVYRDGRLVSEKKRAEKKRAKRGLTKAERHAPYGGPKPLPSETGRRTFTEKRAKSIVSNSIESNKRKH